MDRANTSRPTRLDTLQAGRCGAARLVVLFHMTGTAFDVYGVELMGELFSFGFAGVDFFFVLSGFIITYTARGSIGKPQALRRYLTRRLVRVYPIYWIIIVPLLAALVLGILPYKVGLEPSGWEVVSALGLWFGHTNFNGVSWTLTHEVYFYLAFALPIFSRKLIPVPLLLYTAAVAAVLWGADSKAIQVMAAPINLEFLLGVSVALVLFNRGQEEPRLHSRKLGLVILIFGLLSFLLIGVFLANLAPSSWRLLMFGVPAALIVFGLVLLETMGDFRVPRLLVTLGNASYVLYLVHLPLVRGVNKLAVSHIGHSGFQVTLLNLILLALLCVLSILIHRHIEKPTINFLNRRSAEKFSRSPGN